MIFLPTPRSKVAPGFDWLVHVVKSKKAGTLRKIEKGDEELAKTRDLDYLSDERISFSTRSFRIFTSIFHFLFFI